MFLSKVHVWYVHHVLDMVVSVLKWLDFFNEIIYIVSVYCPNIEYGLQWA